MSEYSDLAGKRDYSTPLHMTGRPYVKTYYDWVLRCYRTDVCILLGAREEPPGKPWADRPENAGKGKVPELERKRVTPQDHRELTQSGKAPGGKAETRERIDSIRSRIRALLAERKVMTNAEICKAMPDVNVRSIAATPRNDKLVVQVSGRSGSGRVANDSEKARYSLRESEESDE